MDVAQGKSHLRKHQLCVIHRSPGKTSLQANPSGSKFATERRQEQEIQYSRMCVSKELRWWLRHINQLSPIHHKDPTVFITTDALDQGWGATINDANLSGSWTIEQQSWHSNRKELWTLKRVLQELAHNFRGQTVLAQTDNQSVAIYITKERGTKSLKLLRLAKDILSTAYHNQIHLIARYLPGKYNLLADCLSRFRQAPE